MGIARWDRGQRLYFRMRHSVFDFAGIKGRDSKNVRRAKIVAWLMQIPYGSSYRSGIYADYIAWAKEYLKDPEENNE